MNLSRHHIFGLTLRLTSANVVTTQVRNARWIKPWPIGPEGLYKRLRGEKVIKVDLPDFERIRRDKDLTPEEIRSKLKEKGLVPPRQYTERPVLMSATGGILDPFVPPEGDGKASFISQAGAKQMMDRVTKKGRSFMALRKVRTFEDEFDVPQFAEEALDLYIKAHEALANNDHDLLHELVTEHAFPEMTYKTDTKTIRWKFISTIDKPIVSHIRTLDMLSKNNVFAQITVRFNTRQILAIYDRFGYLMHGSEAIVKDVLEYVIFEKHLSNLYGKWRIHAKIIPDWMPPKEPIRNTFVSPPEPPAKTEREIQYEKQGLMSDQFKAEQKDKETEKLKNKEDTDGPTPLPA